MFTVQINFCGVATWYVDYKIFADPITNVYKENVIFKINERSFKVVIAYTLRYSISY